MKPLRAKESGSGAKTGFHTAWRASAIGAWCLALLAILVLFETTSLDLWVQDHLYDAEHGRWMVDAAEPWGRLFFYNGPKGLVWLVALSALAFAAGPERWRRACRFEPSGLWLAIGVLATVPALAGIGKRYTNIFCPSEIRRYGGDVAYAKLCGAYPENDSPSRRGGCFPAGHASGGFALMGLLGIRANARWRRATIVAGLLLGWWMGGYQMMKGAHYLSHTVVTMLAAWIMVLLGQKALSRRSRAYGGY